jgi:hypothetical protein
MEHDPIHSDRLVQGDRLARTEWLIAQLRERAATCADPKEQTNLRRSADALIRLATALRP